MNNSHSHYISNVLLFPMRGTFIALLFLIASFPLLGQVETPPGEQTTAQDTTVVSDSGYIPIPTIPLAGSFDRKLPRDFTLSDTVIKFSDYRYTGDLLSGFSGVFLRDLGTAGQLHGLTIDGVDGRSIAVLTDGILLNDPLSGVFDLNLFPVEHIERIEIAPNTRAFLYGLNSTGGAINFVTKNYQAVKPISKIHYFETAHGYTFFDGMITQDVRRDLNVTIGLQHPAFLGRFLNQAYDAWNFRAKIRYNLSESVNLFASEMYNQTRLGLNGGIDTSTFAVDRFDPIDAVLLSETAYEKITRHDIQLGAALRFLPDSSDVTTVTFFHSTNFREYRDEYVLLDSAIMQDHRTQWYGTRLTQHLSLIGNSLDVGAEVQTRGVLSSSVMGKHLHTYASVWGKDEITFIPNVSASGYARIDHYKSNSRFSYGWDASLELLWGVRLFGGFSHSYRNFTFQENYWQDSVVGSTLPLANNMETHNLIEGGVRWIDERSAVSVKYFRRMVDNPAMILQAQAYNPFPQTVFDFSGGQLTLQGIDASANLRISFLCIEGNAQYLQMKQNGNTLTDFPEWNASGGIYFWDTLLNNHLELKTGVRGRVISAYKGTEYNPQSQMFVPANYWDVVASGIGDFVVMARLGDANIHIIWQNLLNRKYVVMPFYPMQDRAIRLSLDWEFLN